MAAAEAVPLLGLEGGDGPMVLLELVLELELVFGVLIILLLVYFSHPL